MRWWLRSILYYQLHWTGVKPVVDEAIVDTTVLNSDRTELQSISPLVQCPPVGVVPLCYLVIVAEQSQTIVRVRWTLATVTALTHPLYQVDVGGGGHAPTC